MVGTVLGMDRTTFVPSVFDKGASMMMPGDLVTTPSIAAFLRDDWVGLGSSAMAQVNVPEWMQTATQLAVDNATVAIGHLAPAVALIH